MIEDENHPMMRAAEDELRLLLQRFVGRSFTNVTYDGLVDVCRSHRARWRQQGLDFPRLVALFLPRLRSISLLNAALEGDALKLRIVTFARQHPAATAQEVADAFRQAFPDQCRSLTPLDLKVN